MKEEGFTDFQVASDHPETAVLKIRIEGRTRGRDHPFGRAFFGDNLSDRGLGERVLAAFSQVEAG